MTAPDNNDPTIPVTTKGSSCPRLAKGLAVLGAFGKQGPAMTLSDAGRRLEPLTSNPRRQGSCAPLAQLGYCRSGTGRAFSSLTPGAFLETRLCLSLSGRTWIDRALGR